MGSPCPLMEDFWPASGAYLIILNLSNRQESHLVLLASWLINFFSTGSLNHEKGEESLTPLYG